MLEFGSDFHYIDNFQGTENTLKDFYPNAKYYADGRQALVHLYHSQGWERLWVPTYFCYEVIESLKRAGLNLMLYTDYPRCNNDEQILESIQRKGHFNPTDAILRVNYFGMRSPRNAKVSNVAAIVEDHTHDLIGDWAEHSTADWCIASLRKTLPIPEGGVLWSPKGLDLTNAPNSSDENERIATVRWRAMKLKARYIAGETVEKAAFREVFIGSEDYFDTAPVSSLDNDSQKYLQSFCVREWYDKKRENWNLLKDIRKGGIQVIQPESVSCYPFSLMLLFNNLNERDRVRKELIAHQIYPAILWNIPTYTSGEVYRLSQCTLSIHCDARYTQDEILTMKSIIESIL